MPGEFGFMELGPPVPALLAATTSTEYIEPDANPVMTHTPGLSSNILQNLEEPWEVEPSKPLPCT